MQKKILLNLITISLTGIILTTLLLFFVQTVIAHNISNDNFKARFHDVEERIALSALQTNELTDTIKEDYLSRARALAMIIELDPDIIRNSERLNEIALTLDVNEIHIINENGILEWGTVPDYYGKDFSATDQTRPFLKILDDPELEIAQDPMPNGFASVLRQYAGVSLRGGKGIAQIGMVPERYENALKNSEINNILRGVHIRNTGYIFSVDLDTRIINSHPNTELIGTKLTEDIGGLGFLEIDGETVRFSAEAHGTNLLIAVLPTTELYAERTFFTPIFLGFSIMIFGAFCVSVNIIIKRNIITGIQETVETLENISGGNLDVTVNVCGNAEFVKLSSGINHMLSSIKNMINENASLSGDRGRLGAIVATADAGIIVKDKKGTITDWNVGATHILGYSPEEIIGHSTKHYAPDEQHNDIDAIQERLEKGEHISHLDVVRRHKDGRLIYCSASYSPVFDEKNAFNGSVAIFHDVTSKKLYEEKVQKLGAIVSASNAGIVVRDENCIIVEWNIGAENILGYSADEIIGKHTSYFFPDDFKDDFDYIHTRIQKGENTSYVVETVHKHKEGKLIDCSVSYSPIYNEKGNFAGSVAIFHDVSDKKQIETELEETLTSLWDAVAAAERASSVKSTFLANMSHEIRTPMNAVIGMSDLLLSENLTPRQHRFVCDIKSSGTNLLGIINSILDLSKIEAGKFELIPIDYDFYGLLENIDSVFRFSAQSKNIEYITEKADGLPQCLFGDDIRLRQVLTNLLGNAVKFTSKGYVKLKTWFDNDSIFFDVIDTGIGIKQEDIDKLFNAFEQVDSGINRAKVGTGLGLSITKSIIGTMNGSIFVTSEYGAGTTFHVQIPYVLGDKDKIQAQAEEENFISAPTANVLVVDDFDVNLKVAAGLLELFAIKCDTAMSGEKAIEMVTKNKYDIIFMDHMMPEMDGVETTVRLRLMGYDEKDYPIIALTANAVEGVSEMMIESGMNDFLSKPIDKNKLNALLIKWLPPSKVKERGDNFKAAGQKGLPPEIQAGDDIRRLREIKVLDVDIGLAFMGNSEKLYKDTLRIVAKRIPELVKSMTTALNTSNTHKFINDVHCIKSSLGTIGADMLSKQAADMEQKAKADYLDYCSQLFPSFVAGVMSLHERLGAIFGTGANQPSDVYERSMDLKQQLLEIKRCLSVLEDETALDLLADLAKIDFGDNVNNMLKQLEKHVEVFEFKQASECLEKMLALFNEN